MTSRQVFTEETLGSAALVRRLVGLEDRPWADGASGRPITQAHVARLLRPFGIHPMKLRVGAKTANGYAKQMFVDPWSRYLPKRVEHWNTANNDGDGLGNSRGNQTQPVPVRKRRLYAIDTGHVPVFRLWRGRRDRPG